MVIVDDDDDADDEDDDEDDDDEDNDEANMEDVVPLVDEDDTVRCQYSTHMEAEGSILTSGGVRRSMRNSKGRAPTRYVDEEYVDLMTGDVDMEHIDTSEEEFSCSEEELDV